MAHATCSIPGCSTPAKHTGLCGSHYKRKRRWGDPLYAGPGSRGSRGIQDPDPKKRFRWLVNVNGSIPSHRPDLGPCHVWTGQKTEDGYGRFHRETGTTNREMAYRVAIEWELGHPIAEGLTPDHLCRNPPCVRPSHFELVPMKVNILRGVGAMAINSRKTHCPQNHPYDDRNTRWYQGRRYCRACGYAALKKRRAARRVA